MRAIYSPITPSEISCTPEKKAIDTIKVANPGVSTPRIMVLKKNHAAIARAQPEISNPKKAQIRKGIEEKDITPSSAKRARRAKLNVEAPCARCSTTKGTPIVLKPIQANSPLLK